MTVIVNDSLLSYLLDVEAWTLRAEGARADRYIGDAIGTGAKPRQLQGSDGRRFAPCAEAEGADR